MLLGKSTSSPMFVESFKLRSRLLTHYYCALAACGRSRNTAKLSAIMGWSWPNVQGLKPSTWWGLWERTWQVPPPDWNVTKCFQASKGSWWQVQLPTYSSLIATCVRDREKLWNPSIPPVKTDKFPKTVPLYSPLPRTGILSHTWLFAFLFFFHLEKVAKSSINDVCLCQVRLILGTGTSFRWKRCIRLCAHMSWVTLAQLSASSSPCCGCYC